MGGEIILKDYNLKAITGGTDALADVTITIEDKNGHTFRAQGVNEDIIMASALALVNGINKSLNLKNNKLHGE
jgi:hypothetical protein